VFVALLAVGVLLLVSTKFKVLASLQDHLVLLLAFSALQTKNYLLRCFGLLVEDGLGLTTITRLFAIVTSLTLGSQSWFANFVLGNLVWGMLLAMVTRAESISSFWDVDHCGIAKPKQTATLLNVAITKRSTNATSTSSKPQETTSPQTLTEARPGQT